MNIFIDSFNNQAIIRKKRIYPYHGAKTRRDSFQLKIISRYNNMCIYLAMYDSEQDALNKLKEMSCGTFKKIEIHINL